MEIIPAIDLIDGKCVRLTQGDYAQKKEYSDDPVSVAQQFEAAGIRRLHVVDLDGAKAKQLVNLPVVQAICENTTLQVDFGGGIRREEDVETIINAGVHQVTAGSIAAREPERVMTWISRFGSERIILGADVKNMQIAVHGWQEQSNWELFEFLEMYLDRGVEYAICTDVNKDGMMSGPATQLYRQVISHFPQLKLIASGGVAELEDLHRLQDVGVYGAIVGKAFYEGAISMEALSGFVNS
ncbi:MAG: 1-(5-phosphoribosyl)-5-[(5-phosphoribosylamino)methylideneamino]imidazole-4-carboxamide isomerase [Bacteroidota bacterium]